ncbi:hypothetical protein ACHAQJ_008612 [Trichoderma viride]
MNNTIDFELTPIELNGARRYKRVALILPLALTGNDFDGETTMTEQCILKMLFDAIATWPILTGGVRRVGQRYGMLTMRARAPSTDTEPRTDLIDTHTQNGNNTGIQELVFQIVRNSLSRDFFPSERSFSLVTGMPPVLMKMTFFGNQLVLGFSFYEAVIDGEFISRFFSWMSDLSWSTTGSEGSILYRTPLKPAEGARVNAGLFPFYDWSHKPTEQPTPRDRLVCRLVEFKKHEVLSFIGGIRRAIYGVPDLISAEDDDYVVAILWVAIMQARYSKGKVSFRDTARLNILLPGEPHARRMEERDGTYFGNSTAPTLASLSVQNLVFEIGERFRNYAINNSIYSIRGLVEAASEIRRAMDLVDTNYVEQLMGLKKTLRPELDWAAYERGIDRNTTGVTFEDWSGYFGGSKVMGIPFTTGRPLRVLPCADDLEDGKIILLPQLGAPNIQGDEVGWSAWLCLEAEIMEVVLAQLNIQNWIIGGEF